MKNKYIELERLLASCMILLYHLGVAKASWIFVEFFFILSGYFLMQHLESHKQEIEEHAAWYPLGYTWRRYSKLLPYTCAGVFGMWAINAIRWKLTGTAFMKWLLFLPCDLLMIGGTGMFPYGIIFSASLTTPRIMNGHLWYICCMLIVMPFVIYLLMNSKKSRALCCSIVPALIYGYIIMKDGRVNGWHSERYGFFYCNLRALAGLLLGAGVWYASQWWKKRSYTNLGKIVLTIAEVFSFFAVAVISFGTTAPYDCLEIGLLALSISLTLSGVTYTSKFDCRLAKNFGTISLAIYCLQMPIIHALAGRLGEYRLPITFVIVFACGILYDWAVRLLQRWYHHNRDWIRRMFLSK